MGHLFFGMSGTVDETTAYDTPFEDTAGTSTPAYGPSRRLSKTLQN